MTKVLLPDRKIKVLVEQSVNRALREIFTDPDYGLELTLYAKRRLNRSIQLKKSGKLISLDEVLKKQRIDG